MLADDNEVLVTETHSSKSVPTKQPRQYSTLLLAVVVIGGMFLTQLIKDGLHVSPKKEAPGLTRGDLVLNDETLPTELAGWTKTQFLPALEPEKLPEGQWWWTHAWHYQQNPLAALVAFDQADWTGWHELTVCYRATGWELTKRAVYDVSDINSRNWRYVVAEFEKNGLERGLLVFSEFHEDASPTLPFEIDLLAPRPNPGLEERFLNRFTNTELIDAETPNSESGTHHERAVQCQVFGPHRQDLTTEMIESIISLHLESRTRFRNAWIEDKLHISSSATNSRDQPSRAQTQQSIDDL